MLQIKIIWKAFIALYLIAGCLSAHGSDKTIGELMLSSGEPEGFDEVPQLRQALFEDDYASKVHFLLFTRSSKGIPMTTDGKDALNRSTFDPAKKTLLVIHGFLNDLESESIQGIKNAALEYHDINVINVGWSYFTRNANYGWVASKVRGVGTYIGQFIESLIAKGLNRLDLHLVGHSLGAHVVGFAGKQLRRHGHTVARITGLDPAFPGFYNIYDVDGRLNAGDAEFVDCIHTCGGKLGFPIPICQADFFPNGGQDVQPGCTPFDFGSCSHGRAHQFFAESMNLRHLFKAETCEGMALWIPYNCYNEEALMGYPASAKFKGPLILTTNSDYPFAKTIIPQPESY